MNYLAQAIVTNKEVKIFLDNLYAESEVLKGRMENSNNPITLNALEDVKEMLIKCRTISDKIENEKELNLEEKEYLKGLLNVNKRQIEEEGEDTSGIAEYLSQLG